MGEMHFECMANPDLFEPDESYLLFTSAKIDGMDEKVLKPCVCLWTAATASDNTELSCGCCPELLVFALLVLLSLLFCMLIVSCRLQTKVLHPQILHTAQPGWQLSQ